MSRGSLTAGSDAKMYGHLYSEAQEQCGFARSLCIQMQAFLGGRSLPAPPNGADPGLRPRFPPAGSVCCGMESASHAGERVLGALPNG